MELKGTGWLLLWMMGAVFLMASCEKDPELGNYWVDPQSDSWVLDGNLIPAAVKDVDGNTYDAVRIGTQIWMQQNLRTTHYADSTPVERLSLPGEFELCDKYGYLYDWDAAVKGTDSSFVQGVCPDGWHLPSRIEWDQLFFFLKNSPQYYVGSNTEYIAKSLASTSDWDFCNDNIFSPGYNPVQNNASCFSAFPAGYCEGNYYSIGSSANFWSATDDNVNAAREIVVESCSPQLTVTASPKTKGCSVRCVQN